MDIEAFLVPSLSVRTDGGGVGSVAVSLHSFTQSCAGLLQINRTVGTGEGRRGGAEIVWRRWETELSPENKKTLKGCTGEDEPLCKCAERDRLSSLLVLY